MSSLSGPVSGMRQGESGSLVRFGAGLEYALVAQECRNQRNGDIETGSGCQRRELATPAASRGARLSQGMTMG